MNYSLWRYLHWKDCAARWSFCFVIKQVDKREYWLWPPWHDSFFQHPQNFIRNDDSFLSFPLIIAIPSYVTLQFALVYWRGTAHWLFTQGKNCIRYSNKWMQPQSVMSVISFCDEHGGPFLVLFYTAVVLTLLTLFREIMNQDFSRLRLVSPVMTSYNELNIKISFFILKQSCRTQYKFRNVRNLLCMYVT